MLRLHPAAAQSMVMTSLWLFTLVNTSFGMTLKLELKVPPSPLVVVTEMVPLLGAVSDRQTAMLYCRPSCSTRLLADAMFSAASVRLPEPLAIAPRATMLSTDGPNDELSETPVKLMTLPPTIGEPRAASAPGNWETSTVVDPPATVLNASSPAAKVCAAAGAAASASIASAIAPRGIHCERFIGNLLQVCAASRTPIVCAAISDQRDSGSGGAV